MRLACVTGLAGERLTESEARFLRDAEPAGLILFARNVRDVEQMRRLIGDARECIGADDALVLIDQEGGRVQRMGPPVWPKYPAAAALGVLFERDPDAGLTAAHHLACLIASDLGVVGVNTNCVPVADVPVDGAHDVIGHRAYGRDPKIVVPLARAVAKAHLACGLVPVVKHVPGHGRAQVDSHDELPIVSEPQEVLVEKDFRSFRDLADLPAMMTAHVVFTDIDDSAPASTSRGVHDAVIRGEIGFDGLLFSDDLSMNALEGPIGRRAAGVIAAGSDLALHCNGNLAEMEAVASAVPELRGRGADRFLAACGHVGEATPFDRDEAEHWLGQIREIAEESLN
ncbi:MAG: beta-N-acetylhexosaminidase [Pseudomonadota bacterium]